MINRNELRVAIVVLTATAYFTIFYDIFQNGLKSHIQNYIVYTISGITALGIGIFALWLLSTRQKKSTEQKTLQDHINNKNQKLDTERMYEEKGSKRLRIVDVVIIVIIIICLSGAFYVYFLKDDNVIYNYTGFYKNNTKSNYTDFVVSFNFSAPTFSAQQEITVTAIASLHPDFIKNHHAESIAIQKLYLYFPTGVPPNTTYTNGHALDQRMLLTKDTYDQNYTGDSQIVVYQTEGQKCIIISTIDLRHTSDECPSNSTLLTISSIDSTYQYKTNKISIVLTLILIAFTVVAVRDFFDKMGHNLGLLKKRPRTAGDDPNRHIRK